LDRANVALVVEKRDECFRIVGAAGAGLSAGVPAEPDRSEVETVANAGLVASLGALSSVAAVE
jgi:hypothetical protein